MAVLDRLVVALGFEFEDAELTDFQREVNKTEKMVLGFAAGVVAASAALFTFVKASTAATDEQGKLSIQVGESVEEVDAWQHAASLAGDSAEGMGDSMLQLSIRASEAARGLGAGVEAFGLLGIEAVDAAGAIKPASRLLLEVSQAMVGLSNAQQIELADKLGLRGSMRLLQQGPAAIRALIADAKALGVTTEEDASISADFQDQLVRVWRIVRVVGQTLTRELAPILQETNDIFIEWWKTNKDIIKQNLPDWLDRARLAFRLLTIAAAGFVAIQLGQTLITLIKFLRGVTIQALAANVSALLLPIALGAAALAFSALVEDAKVFFEGGDSFISDMIKRFPEWAEGILIVASVLGTVADLTLTIFEGWNEIFKLFKSAPTLEDVTGVLGDIPGFLGDLTGLAPVGGGGPLSGLLGGNTTSSSSMQIDKLEIAVSGAGDPQAVAREVRNQFQQATQDLNSAVEQ